MNGLSDCKHILSDSGSFSLTLHTSAFPKLMRPLTYREFKLLQIPELENSLENRKTHLTIKAYESSMVLKIKDKNPYLWSIGIQLSQTTNILYGALMTTFPKSLIIVIFLIIK